MAKKEELNGAEVEMNSMEATAELVVETTAEGDEVTKAESGRRLSVKRKPFTSNGKQCYEYLAVGKFRDKEQEIGLVAPDRDGDGFTLLNDVVDGASRLELAVIVTKTKDRRTNRIRTFTSYEIWAIFEDGTVYKTPVIPNKRSDEAKIDLIMNQS